jgi:diguanylate cyclase (GGDEF)-like protein/PAS domain S-box-containing protein
MENTGESVRLQNRLRLYTVLSFVAALGVCLAFGALLWQAYSLERQKTAEIIAANQGSVLQASRGRSLTATATLLRASGYHYQLSYRAPGSAEPVLFASSSAAPLREPVMREIMLPNATWRLSIAPVDGWNPPYLSLAAAAAALLAAALVAWLTHGVLRQPILLRRDVAARTLELARTNHNLEREIAQRERAQAAAARTTRLYRVLSRTNAAIIRVADRAQLCQEICDIAVEDGGFPLATIALLDGRGGSWGSVVSSGHVARLGACDTLHDCAECTGTPAPSRMSPKLALPTCLATLATRFTSHVSFELSHTSEPAGRFSLYGDEADLFDPAQLSLLEEMANDLSFALDNIDHEELRRQGEQRLRKLSRAVEQSANAVVITDRKGIIEYVNPWFTKITGYAGEDVIGQTPRILKSLETSPEIHQQLWDTLLAGKEWHGEMYNTKKSGELYWCMEAISPLKNEAGEVTHFVAISEDISHRKQAEQTITHMAFHDALTGLPNRRLFHDRLLQALALGQRNQSSVALMLLDLDHFKQINDTLGHDAGDEVLVIIAARLSASIRKTDTLARMGGDEFALIAVDLAHAEDVGRLAAALQEALRVPVQVKGRELYLSTSIGITVFPNDSRDADCLIKNADIALYRAKDKGRDNFQFFTSEMNTAILQRQQLENSMRCALDRHEFRLLYQPQVDLVSGRIECVEALIRWHHPELGIIGPTQFIALAEETGMIVAIGEWVLRSACAQARAWQLDGMPLRVAVNLSARQFRQGDLADKVAHILRASELSSSLLELELTEGMLMEDTAQTSATLDTLHRMGVQISIDDFGTGYSSLSYLKRLPIDILKIDQSFVRDIHTDPDDRSIVTAVIALAHSLNLSVVAEGVETPEQLAFLRELRCDAVQGFLFSLPVAAEAMAALFHAASRNN